MIWFPVPEGVTSLPPAPSPTVNSTPNAVDTVSAPPGFDPDNVDIDDLFNNIVQTNVAPVYPEELDTVPLIQPFDEILEVEVITTCGFTVLEAQYSLTPVIENVVLTVKCIGSPIYFIDGNTSTYTLQGNAAGLVYTRDSISRTGAFTATGNDISFKVNPEKIYAQTANYNLDTIRRIAVHSGEGSLLDTLEENNAIAIGTGFTISYSTFKFGSGSISNTSSAIVHLTRRTTSSKIRAGQNFTVSFWCQPSSTAPNFVPVFSLNEEYVIAEYNVSIGVYAFAFGRLSAGTGNGLVATNVVFTPIVIGATALTNSFTHVALEVYNSQVRIYTNGIASSPAPAPNLEFTDTAGFTLFGVPVYAEDGSISRNTSFSNGLQYFDDIVIDNGSRYLGNNFTLPTAPLANLASVSFIYRKNLAANTYALSVTGQNATLNVLDAELYGGASSFILAGQSVDWKRSNRVMAGSAGSIALTGQSTLEGPIFVAGSNTTGNYSTSTATSRLITLPSNLAIDDIIVLVAETSGEVATYPELVGWNLVNNAPLVTSADSSGCQLYVWWRRVSSLTQPAVYLPVVNHIAYGAFTVRGAVPTGNPIEVIATSISTNSNTVIAPSLTTLRPLSRVFIITAHPTSTSSTTVYSSITNANLKAPTEHFEFSTTNGNGGGFGVFSGSALKSTTIGTTSIVKTITSVNASFVLSFVSTAVVTGPAQYTINCNPGTYSLQGQTVTLRSQRKLVGQETSTVLAGQIASFISGKILIGQAALFVSTGQDAQWTVLRALTGSAGAFSLAGQNASFVVNIGSLVGDQFELTALLEDDLLTLDF